MLIFHNIKSSAPSIIVYIVWKVCSRFIYRKHGSLINFCLEVFNHLLITKNACDLYSLELRYIYCLLILESLTSIFEKTVDPRESIYKTVFLYILTVDIDGAFQSSGYSSAFHSESVCRSELDRKAGGCRGKESSTSFLLATT